MDKQDKFYIIFIISFIGVIAGVPIIQNTQFAVQTKQLGDFIIFFYNVAHIFIHNQEILIHNQAIIVNNQYQFAHYGMPHLVNQTTPNIKNDYRNDFENITIPNIDTD